MSGVWGVHGFSSLIIPFPALVRFARRPATVLVILEAHRRVERRGPILARLPLPADPSVTMVVVVLSGLPQADLPVPVVVQRRGMRSAVPRSIVRGRLVVRMDVWARQLLPWMERLSCWPDWRVDYIVGLFAVRIKGYGVD